VRVVMGLLFLVLKIETIKVKIQEGVLVDFPVSGKINIVIFDNGRDDVFRIDMVKRLVAYEEKIIIWVIDGKEKKEYYKSVFFVNKSSCGDIKKIFNMKGDECLCRKIGIVMNGMIKYFNYGEDTDFIFAWVKERVK
jgi:hypothetical protein